MSSLRIILAPSAYYPHVGGIEELTRQLALELESRGHTVSVLTNRWPAGVSRSEVLDGVRVTRLRFPLPAARVTNVIRFLLSAPTAALQLVRHLHVARADVVHVIGAGPQSVYLGFVVQLLRVRLVFTAQGELTFDAHDVFRRSAILRAALRHVVRRADAVTACSAFVLDGLRSAAPGRDDAVVIPNGVNPSDFSQLERRKPERQYVLAVGRLVRQKGFDVLIDAFASGQLSSLDLVIAGEGPERDRLVSQAAKLGVENQLRLVGAVDRAQLAHLMAGARVFAFPSRGEPFGIALLEAMAAGMPCVATRSGGVEEFARDGENALLVAPNDAAGLTAAIARLDEGTELRRRLGESGRETARGLAWSFVASRYEDIYAPGEKTDAHSIGP